MYNVPEENYFRIHHIRPRFKNNVENVLIYMATEISKLTEMDKLSFNRLVDDAIACFPGNATLTDKTIANWRTEISALFGFIENGKTKNALKPGIRALELSEKQDLVENFKIFLYFFQYPGGHIKAHENAKLIEQGIKFKPCQFILKLLEYAEKRERKRISLNKAEVTHCIFNDLRCTRDNEDVANVWDRIKHNKENKVEYDWNGDTIRYAGDILDYMEIANLLVSHGGRYYINWLEREGVYKFISSSQWYDGYDSMIASCEADSDLLKCCQEEWFHYVNQKTGDDIFKTDILAFLSSNIDEYEKLKKSVNLELESKIESPDSQLSTKDIGDWGENLIHGHECARVRNGGRMDLVHLIKVIPTQLAVGFDIQSVELDERKRYIEVKTTISNKELNFNKIHLTPNEWGTANSIRDRYYVYRLFISKENKKLYIMQDPVGLYKGDKIQMTPRDGADISFDRNTCGYYEELLSW